MPDPIYESNKHFITADEAINTYFFRPLAWPLVILLSKTRITPNQVSLLGLIPGIAAGYFYYLGGHFYFFLGGCFLLLASLFDCADGPLARIRRIESQLGKVVDGVVDHLVGLSVLTGFYLNVYRQGEISNITIICLIILITTVLHNLGWEYTKTQFFLIMNEGRYVPVSRFDYYCQTHPGVEFRDTSTINKMLIRISYLHNLLQEVFYSPTEPDAGKVVKYYNQEEREEYKQNYSKIMRLWSWNGGHTHFAFIIIFSMFYRIDIIINGLLIGFNVLWLITFIIHKLHYYGYRTTERTGVFII